MYQKIKLLGYEMGSYSICVSIGLAFGAVFVFWQLKRMAASPERENSVMPAIPITFILGVVGAHIIDVLFRGGIKALIQTPLAYGLTFYGWLMTALIFLVIYAKIVRLPSAYMLNLFCPAFAIAQAWGRLGCFLGGCCYGRPSPWGLSYPAGSLPHTHYGDQPLIPVQLYESIYLLIVFIVLITCIRFKRRAIWYLILIPVGRFILEFYRADDRGVLLKNTLSPSQWLSIAFFAVGISWLITIKLKEKLKGKKNEC